MKIRRMLNEKKGKMTDEEFFCSNAMNVHFMNIISGICQKYKTTIKVEITSSGNYVARTNGTTVKVNCSCDWIQEQDSRVNKYYVIIGLILHECGHILYTDFNLMEKCMYALENNELYPSVKLSDKLREIFENKEGVTLLKVYKTLDNCIEDGHIEKRIIKHVPGYGECLLKVRKLHASENVFYSEMLEKGKTFSNVSLLLQFVLIYAKFGIDLVGTVEDEISDVFRNVKDNIKRAVKQNDAFLRKKEVNVIFNKLAEYICDNLSSEDELDDLLDDMGDCTEHDNTEDMSPVETEEADGMETECDESEASEANGQNSSTEDREEGSDEWDLSYLEDQTAEELVAEDIKRGIEKKLQQIATDTRKSRVDKYPSEEKYIDPDGEAVAEYESTHDELDKIARRVVKNLDKVIKERLKGDKLTGLYSGKQLDVSHVYRKDKKIMSNKVLPGDAPDMEVCVLVDCSGSMRIGTRMEQSRKCAYITWKFCQLMDIPCSVYGHTTTSDEKKVKMTCVAHCDNIDKDDCKRIFMLRAERNNRDGWAVNYCAEALSKSTAKLRLLFIISDGIPEAFGYSFALGKRDCQEVVKRYKKQGITVITAGIDDCTDDIKDVYLDGAAPKDAALFLDYSDMSRLPKAFATIIKKKLA